MRSTRGTPAQRRSEATPLALVLAGWALAVAPIAHPLLAHGTPFLPVAADEGWVHHATHGSHGQGGVPLPPAHHHAPGAPEHLQLPLLAATAPTSFETVLVAVRPPPPSQGVAVSLPRRWSEERPQAP
ncbi:MAG TPA: hypothetical protein VFI53_17405 [Myxococcaceae bacterium]|nr:hypothetical protein [Myxococcaceae bacterium]